MSLLPYGKIPPRIEKLVTDLRVAGHTVGLIHQHPLRIEVFVQEDGSHTGHHFRLYWRKQGSRWKLTHSSDGWRENVPIAEVRFRLIRGACGVLQGLLE